MYENIGIMCMSEVFFEFVELSWSELSVMLFLFYVLIIIVFFVIFIKRDSINFFIFGWGVFSFYIIIFVIIC